MTRAGAKGCSICAHPDRRGLETLVAQGASVRAVADKRGVGYHALWRHCKNHITPARRATLLSGVARLADIADKAADEGTSLIDHLRALRNQLFDLMDACHAVGDARTAAQVAGRLIELFREQGRLTGELARAGVSITNNNLFISPQWAEVQGTLVQVLARHPEARADVVRAFREIEGRSLRAISSPRVEEAHASAAA